MNTNKVKAEKIQKETKPSTTIGKEIKEWVKSAAVAIVILLILNIFFFSARVDGESMAPTLSHRDRLIVNRLAYLNETPQYGDIVVFYCEPKGYTLIKRVIGLPGDKIEITDGEVYRNGSKLDESAYIDCLTNGNISTVVDEGKVFVLGDNRPDSADSRYAQIGQIPFENIKGKVLVRLFPNPKIPK